MTQADLDLSQRAIAWQADSSLDTLSVERLGELSRAEGTDFATALLYTRILQSERFGPAIDAIRRSPNRWTSSRRPALLALVPGAFHGEHMDTGADGRRFLEIAHGQGFRSQVIPTHSFGSISQNAQIVGEWLSSRAGEEIVLVCLSKAAAEAGYLLREENSGLLRNVAAVVNLSPMIAGSKLVDRVLDHPLRRLFVHGFMWWKNYDFRNLAELRYNPGPLPAFNPGIPIMNVNGFPLEQHLSSAMARRQYHRMQPDGPNDGGGVLLADTLRLPGTLFPVWGADHYMRRPDTLPNLLGQILYTAVGYGCRIEAAINRTLEQKCIRAEV